MLTVGGLLLGAVLTAPVAASGAAPTDPFESTETRVILAQRDAEPRLRDPFAPAPAHLQAAATHLHPPRPSADLLDPFAAGPGTDLRAPFDPSTRVTAPTPAPQVRDPFGG